MTRNSLGACSGKFVSMLMIAGAFGTAAMAACPTGSVEIPQGCKRPTADADCTSAAAEPLFRAAPLSPDERRAAISRYVAACQQAVAPQKAASMRLAPAPSLAQAGSPALVAPRLAGTEPNPSAAPRVDWKAMPSGAIGSRATGSPAQSLPPRTDPGRSPAEPPATGGAKAVTAEPALALTRPVMQQVFRAVKVEPVKLPAVQLSTANMPNADLRPRIKSLNIGLRHQGTRPTCSVHAMTFLLEYMYSTRKQLSMHDLSEEYLNYAANVVTKKNADGDFFSNLDLGYQALGIYMEQLVPYKASFDPKYKVPAEYVAVAKKWERFQAEFVKAWDAKTGATMGQLYRVMVLLESDTPVAVGMWWPTALKSKTVNGVPVLVTPSARNVDAEDGHSVVLVGYRKDPGFPGGGYFVFRNSYGPGWGDHGHGYVSFEYLLKYANDLVAYRE